jgi:hypothetical protein
VRWVTVLLKDPHVTGHAFDGWQHLFSQQHIPIVLAIDFYAMINKNELCDPNDTATVVLTGKFIT